MERQPVTTSSASPLQRTKTSTMISHVPMQVPVASHVPMSSHPVHEHTALSEAVSPEDLDLLVSYIAQITCIPVEQFTEPQESRGNIPAIDKLLDDKDIEMTPQTSKLTKETPSAERLTDDKITEIVMQILSGSNTAAKDVSTSACRSDLPSILTGSVSMSTDSGIFSKEPVRSISPESSSSEGQCYGTQDSPLSDDSSHGDLRMQASSEGYIEQGCNWIYQGQGHETGTTSQEGQPRLWKFVLDLIEDPRYNPSLITWVSREEGIFKLTDPNRLAEFWGQVKGNKSMNYEKFSRGLRYYYTHRVLEHVPGKLVYKFGEGATSVWKYLSQTISAMYGHPPFVSQSPSHYSFASQDLPECGPQFHTAGNAAEPEVMLKGPHGMLAASRTAARRCPNVSKPCQLTQEVPNFLLSTTPVTSQEGISFMSQAMNFEPHLSTTQQMSFQQTLPVTHGDVSGYYTSSPMHQNLTTTSTASTMSSRSFPFPSPHPSVSPVLPTPITQSPSSFTQTSSFVPRTTATVTSQYPPYTTY